VAQPVSPAFLPSQPPSVLARPRWRDQLVWQASEVFYFASVWWYLQGDLTPSSGDTQSDVVYWIAVFVRMAGELYLVALVTRDLLHPRYDPAGAERVPAPPPALPVHRHRADQVAFHA